MRAVYHGVIAAVLAGLLYAHASQTNGSIKASLMLALVPGISAVAAVPILNESFGALTVAGLLCVSVGAILGAIASSSPGVRRG